MDKQKEILELRKTYLNQFEKHETKILIAWFGIIVLPLFILWIQGKMDGFLLLIIALFSCILDIIFQAWRNNSFNDLIKSIEKGEVSTIKPESNHNQDEIVPTSIVRSRKVESKETDNERDILLALKGCPAGQLFASQKARLPTTTLTLPLSKQFRDVHLGFLHTR